MTTKELYKQLMTYTPFKTGSVESYDEYLIRNRKEKIELIRQFKKEVRKELVDELRKAGFNIPNNI